MGCTLQDWRKTLAGKFLDWLDRQIPAVILLVMLIIPSGIGFTVGYLGSYEDAKRLIEKHDKEAFEVYAKQQKMIEELTLQRDECRRIAGVRENRTAQK